MPIDEATADRDTETEELFPESVDRLIAERTAFVIAHRISTIRAADGVVVTDDGEIAEPWTHAEFLLEPGDYAAHWEAQAAERSSRAPVDG